MNPPTTAPTIPRTMSRDIPSPGLFTNLLARNPDTRPRDQPSYNTHGNRSFRREVALASAAKDRHSTTGCLVRKSCPGRAAHCSARLAFRAVTYLAIIARAPARQIDFFSESSASGLKSPLLPRRGHAQQKANPHRIEDPRAGDAAPEGAMLNRQSGKRRAIRRSDDVLAPTAKRLQSTQINPKKPLAGEFASCPEAWPPGRRIPRPATFSPGPFPSLALYNCRLLPAKPPER